MKISVVMVDGGFRENVYSAKYFSNQDFPSDEYEVIWVEFYGKANQQVVDLENVKVIELNRSGIYHSSYCFNAGIVAAKGEIVVIPDADQIVGRDFLQRVYDLHSVNDNLVCYGFRYDEVEQGMLDDHSIEELKKKCVLKNPGNYGGCLTVRKNILLAINGYEQHDVFETGFHANGLDIYTRFKNMGLPIMWDKELILYHPWHDYTLASAKEYNLQKKLINWRGLNLQYMALKGIDESKDVYPELKEQVDELLNSKSAAVQVQSSPSSEAASLFVRIKRKLRRLLSGVKNVFGT